HVRQIAIALDVHATGALGTAASAIENAPGEAKAVLFLEARPEVLVRRFSASRRRHPLASTGSLRDAIAAERAALAPLRERATIVLDTTDLTLSSLKQRLVAAFASDRVAVLAVTMVAFGFKYGIPLDLDLLFDVRFLRNPNYVDALQGLTGVDPEVAAFIEADPSLHEFLSRVESLLDFLIPCYIAEGKSQLTIGIGCTGGRHRSIYVARRLERHLSADDRVSVGFDARDVMR
ncbi:MAG: RNase adapter RapZ, partial [Vulcanimicrobiaceae bacterium]